MHLEVGDVIPVIINDGEKSPTYANLKMLRFPSTEIPSTLSSPEELYREIHNMSQFREPPPYPGLPKKSGSQTGLHKSFSGSEASTDVSVSSTENLPTCHRQEPQGEETQVPQVCLPYDTSCNSDYSILARLGMQTSGKDVTPINTPQIYVTGNPQTMHGPHYATSPSQGFQGRQTLYMSNESGFSSGSASGPKLTVCDNNSTLNSSYTSGFSCDQSPNVSRHSTPNFTSPVSVSSYSSNTLYANFPYSFSPSAIDHSQFSQLQQFSPQSGQMIPQYLTSLPPPPEYPGAFEPMFIDQREAARRSYEVIGKAEIPGSRSQPELSHFVAPHASKHHGVIHTPAGSGSEKGSQHSLEGCTDQPRYSTDIDHIAAQATRMVDFLTEENKQLRQKLTVYDHKVTKLQKFELEIQKLNEGYESLVKSTKKREQLELAMKKRLEDEIKKLKGINSGLIKQLQQAGVAVSENIILASVEAADGSMANLLAKYKELLSIKDRQDMEIDAQRSTIQEQRAQIEILRNIQANQVRLDEEAHREEIIAEYDEKIQQELASIKAAYEKKEQTERSIRQKLEKEVDFCRSNHGQGKKNVPKRDLNADIKKMLDEKEAKILQLEKELIQWKEQHLEESIRKLKLQEVEQHDSSLLPSYEQTTTSSSLNTTESLIHEAKTEKLKQMEEIYQANRKVAELEANVKSLQSQLSEKESILRVYQRSPMTRSSSVHTIYCTPKHSPRPSVVATGSLNRQHSQDVLALSEIRHKKTGSTSALESYSKLSQDELLEKIQGLQKESKSTSDTEDSSAVWQV